MVDRKKLTEIIKKIGDKRPPFLFDFNGQRCRGYITRYDENIRNIYNFVSREKIDRYGIGEPVLMVSLEKEENRIFMYIMENGNIVSEDIGEIVRIVDFFDINNNIIEKHSKLFCAIAEKIESLVLKEPEYNDNTNYHHRYNLIQNNNGEKNFIKCKRLYKERTRSDAQNEKIRRLFPDLLFLIENYPHITIVFCCEDKNPKSEDEIIKEIEGLLIEQY